MKEKNHKRKQALRKAKQQREQKKTLYKEIANFMTKLHLAQIPQPKEALEHFLKNGWKGYNKMRSRDLVGLFEAELKNLQAKNHTMIFYQNPSLDVDIGSWRARSTDQFNIREKMLIRANALLTRLIELAFDLDFEE